MTVMVSSSSPTMKGGQISDADMAHFDAIASFAHQEAGLLLSRDKAPMVLARIHKRMRSCGLVSLSAYRSLVEDPTEQSERAELIYSLTTNVTSFLREEHHFDALRSRLLPFLAEKARRGERVRFWSAGCSSGQEPYSLAMVILDEIPDATDLDIRILSTDIDQHMLDISRIGQYSERQIESVPAALRTRYFKREQSSQNIFTVSAAPRKLVSFRHLNLVSNWPMRGLFDVIFCRNVVIYFDRQTQSRLWSRFHSVLTPQGHLFLGHSERIDPAACKLFHAVGTTMYRAIEQPDDCNRGVT